MRKIILVSLENIQRVFAEEITIVERDIRSAETGEEVKDNLAKYSLLKKVYKEIASLPAWSVCPPEPTLKEAVEKYKKEG